MRERWSPGNLKSVAGDRCGQGCCSSGPAVNLQPPEQSVDANHHAARPLLANEFQFQYVEADWTFVCNLLRQYAPSRSFSWLCLGSPEMNPTVQAGLASKFLLRMLQFAALLGWIRRKVGGRSLVVWCIKACRARSSCVTDDEGCSHVANQTQTSLFAKGRFPAHRNPKNVVLHGGFNGVSEGRSCQPAR